LTGGAGPSRSSPEASPSKVDPMGRVGAPAERKAMESPDDKRRKMLILSFCLVVVTLGSGMVIPIFPFFVENLGAGGRELGLLIATAATIEFIFAPFWGRLSDRRGRKPVLMLGLLGGAITMLLFGLSNELWMLFASRGLAGILTAATMPAAMAYVGDITSDEERGGGMGVIGSAMGLGVILGPGLGGLLAENSLSMPFFVAAGLTMVALFLIIVFLPESKKVDPAGSVEKVKPIKLREALLGPLGGLLVLSFLLSFGLSNFDSVFGIYALERFGYGPQQVGVILMMMALVTILGRGLLTGPVTRRWCETSVIGASLLAGSVGYLGLLLAEGYALVLLATGFFILSRTLLKPTVLSLTSKRSNIGQGVSMGLCNSFMSLGKIVGPIWAGYSFEVDLSYPYISGSVVLLLSFAFNSALTMRERGKPRPASS
jgi:DHA1 family multidrug resistance protein-like MFS transporter